MENPFEMILEELKKSENRIADILKQTLEYHPSVDLDRYIPMKKAAETLGITTKTLGLHKDEIDHVKRFGQIYFLKESLIAYMEGGRPVKEVKKVMRTGRKNI